VWSMDVTFPLRRLSDTLANMGLVEVQLRVIESEAGPPHIKDVGQRIAAIHRQLGRLERQVRARSMRLSENVPHLPSRGVRRHLRQLTALRQPLAGAVYQGSERRRAGRRRHELAAGNSPGLGAVEAPTCDHAEGPNR
jgi:hypothetical protein